MKEDKMEIWDLLDKNGNKVGKTTGKTMLLPEGYYHLGVDVWIKNSEGKYLIQKRSMIKKRLPGKWMATGGSVLAGESGIDAVVRETFEELGIKVNTSKLTFLFKSGFNDCINEVWLLEENIEISSIRMQLDEVCDIRWLNKEQIREMISIGDMINYGTEYIDAVFDEIRFDSILRDNYS
jgi:isopentenyldiphosphate isomerase